jgi:hypothetical protein
MTNVVPRHPRPKTPQLLFARSMPANRSMLKPEHYEQWKEIEITFVPRSMIRG